MTLVLMTVYLIALVLLILNLMTICQNKLVSSCKTLTYFKSYNRREVSLAVCEKTVVVKGTLSKGSLTLTIEQAMTSTVCLSNVKVGLLTKQREIIRKQRNLIDWFNAPHGRLNT